MSKLMSLGMVMSWLGDVIARRHQRPPWRTNRFAAVAQKGSEHRDEAVRAGFLSNHAGGILGGISTSQPIVARFAVVGVDVAADVLGGRVLAAFGHFVFDQFHGARRVGRGDHAAFDVFAEQVENALGVLLVHHHFGGRLRSERN